MYKTISDKHPRCKKVVALLTLVCSRIWEVNHSIAVRAHALHDHPRFRYNVNSFTSVKCATNASIARFRWHCLVTSLCMGIIQYPVSARVHACPSRRCSAAISGHWSAADGTCEMVLQTSTYSMASIKKRKAPTIWWCFRTCQDRAASSVKCCHAFAVQDCTE